MNIESIEELLDILNNDEKFQQYIKDKITQEFERLNKSKPETNITMSANALWLPR